MGKNSENKLLITLAEIIIIIIERNKRNVNNTDEAVTKELCELFVYRTSAP